MNTLNMQTLDIIFWSVLLTIACIPFWYLFTSINHYFILKEVGKPDNDVKLSNKHYYELTNQGRTTPCKTIKSDTIHSNVINCSKINCSAMDFSTITGITQVDTVKDVLLFNGITSGVKILNKWVDSDYHYKSIFSEAYKKDKNRWGRWSIIFIDKTVSTKVGLLKNAIEFNKELSSGSYYKEIK